MDENKLGDNIFDRIKFVKDINSEALPTKEIENKINGSLSS
jgi:hypothetical protein